MICKLCGCEKDTRRQMHGHLMHTHYDDYKRADFILERLTDGAPAPARVYPYRKEKKAFPRPAGFRLLRRSDPAEANAIDQGFDFIDSDQNIYTSQEAKTEGWI